MGNIDSFPVLSQLKSAVEAIGGDITGAEDTQNHFLFNNTFPVISQLVSAGYAIFGYTTEARELQETFALNLLALMNILPIIGHIKGIIHYAVGDSRGGMDALIVASRSLGIIAGGMLGRFSCNFGVVTVIAGLIAAFISDGIIAGSFKLAGEEMNGTAYGYTSIYMGDGISVGQGFDMFVQLFIDGYISLIGEGIYLFIPWVYTMACLTVLKVATCCCCCCLRKGGGGSGGGGGRSQADLDNRANQLNPNNWRYWKSRGYDGIP